MWFVIIFSSHNIILPRFLLGQLPLDEFVSPPTIDQTRSSSSDKDVGRATANTLFRCVFCDALSIFGVLRAGSLQAFIRSFANEKERLFSCLRSPWRNGIPLIHALILGPYLMSSHYFGKDCIPVLFHREESSLNPSSSFSECEVRQLLDIWVQASKEVWTLFFGEDSEFSVDEQILLLETFDCNLRTPLLRAIDFVC